MNTPSYYVIRNRDGLFLSVTLGGQVKWVQESTFASCYDDVRKANEVAKQLFARVDNFNNIC